MEQITPESYKRIAAEISVALHEAISFTRERDKWQVREVILQLLAKLIPGGSIGSVESVEEVSFEIVPSSDPSVVELSVKPKNLFTWLLLAGIYVPPASLGKASRYITRSGTYVYENDIAAFHKGNPAKWINTNASEYRLAPDIKKIP